MTMRTSCLVIAIFLLGPILYGSYFFYKGKKAALLVRESPPIKTKWDKYAIQLSYDLCHRRVDKKWHEDFFLLLIRDGSGGRTPYKQYCILFVVLTLLTFIILGGWIKNHEALIIGCLLSVGLIRADISSKTQWLKGYNETLEQNLSMTLSEKVELLRAYRKEVHLRPFRLAASLSQYSSLARAYHFGRLNAPQSWSLRDFLAMIVAIIAGMGVIRLIWKVRNKGGKNG